MFAKRHENASLDLADNWNNVLFVCQLLLERQFANILIHIHIRIKKGKYFLIDEVNLIKLYGTVTLIWLT